MLHNINNEVRYLNELAENKQASSFFSTLQIQSSKKGTPRNPVFLEYYKRKVSEGKTKIQALVGVMRRLNNIIYGMMKNKTEYVMPNVEIKEVA